LQLLLKILAILALGPNLSPTSFCLCLASTSGCFSQNGCACALHSHRDDCHHAEGDDEHCAQGSACKLAEPGFAEQSCCKDLAGTQIAPGSQIAHRTAPLPSEAAATLGSEASGQGEPSSDCLICQWLEHIDGAPLDGGVSMPADWTLAPLLFLPPPETSGDRSVDSLVIVSSKVPLFLSQCRLLI